MSILPDNSMFPIQRLTSTTKFVAGMKIFFKEKQQWVPGCCDGNDEKRDTKCQSNEIHYVLKVCGTGAKDEIYRMLARER